MAAPKSRFRFRIVHLLYATALVGSALGVLGAPGLCPSLAVLAGWTFVFTSRDRPRALAAISFILLFCVCALCLVPFSGSGPREAARRTQCLNNLRQIALALHAYHDDYGSFPPAHVTDKNGKPMHSWRVLILPYLQFTATYKAYNFNEPWDGPNNRKLVKQIPFAYVCPSNHDPNDFRSHYCAVVGPNAAWSGSTPRKMSHILDGLDQTICIVEGKSKGKNWMDPTDVTPAQARDILNSVQHGHSYDDFFYEYYTGRNVAMVDGSVHFAPLKIDQPQDWMRALTIDGDDPYEFPESSWRKRNRRLKIGNCFRLAFFVLVIFFPLPWVWINPQKEIVFIDREPSIDEAL